MVGTHTAIPAAIAAGPAQLFRAAAPPASSPHRPNAAARWGRPAAIANAMPALRPMQAPAPPPMGARTRENQSAAVSAAGSQSPASPASAASARIAPPTRSSGIRCLRRRVTPSSARKNGAAAAAASAAPATRRDCPAPPAASGTPGPSTPRAAAIAAAPSAHFRGEARPLRA